MGAQRATKHDTRRLLKQLQTTVLREENGMTTLQVGYHRPLVIVTVETRRLRQWCLRRLETRERHVNRAIRGTGGGRTRSAVTGEMIG